MKRKEVELSARMKALTALVTPGRIVCDIGCDHGFVSIYLVQQGIAEKVYAMDVRSGPLAQAQAHIETYGLQQSIVTRRSDGLQNLALGEAECMICAGMGGPLMIKILQEGREKTLAMKELILQPQSEIRQFRRYLRLNGYHIIEEDMIYEDGKYYPMMKVLPMQTKEDTGAHSTESEGELEEKVFDSFGQYLLKHRHPVLKQYLEHFKGVTETLIEKLTAQGGESACARLPELKEQMNMILKAEKFYSEGF